MQKRQVFFISDGTGITAESLGHLLAHFPSVQFEHVRLPFIDTEDKVIKAACRVREAVLTNAQRPIVVVTLLKPSWRAHLHRSGALCLDVFDLFVDPLARELGLEPTGEPGKSRSVTGHSYYERMEAINFTLNHDDGISDSRLDEAQIILIGVSRCGKTPTCLYLAMQFAIKAANYPLTPEDFARGTLPQALLPHIHKIFGLTIKPERLHSVRNERRPASHYASLENCRHEVRMAEALMQRAGIPWLDSTTHSIEEIATTLLQRAPFMTAESFL